LGKNWEAIWRKLLGRERSERAESFCKRAMCADDLIPLPAVNNSARCLCLKRVGIWRPIPVAFSGGSHVDLPVEFIAQLFTPIHSIG